MLGLEYWPDFFDCLTRNLKLGGRAAIQFIAMCDDPFEADARNADFIYAHVFPDELLIKTSEFRRLVAERGLSWEDQEDFSRDYAETLKAWRASFDTAETKDRLSAGVRAAVLRLMAFLPDVLRRGAAAERLQLAKSL